MKYPLFSQCLIIAISATQLLSSNTALRPNNRQLTYAFTNEPIDVVIPAISKDLATLDLCIEGIKKNGQNIRSIYVVSPTQLTQKAYWIDEKMFPFSKKDVASTIFGNETKALGYLSKPGNRIGWIYQQLLKLYVPFVVPGISSNILLLDADTIFLKPVSFLNEKGEPLFNTNTTHYESYFKHAKRLLPGFKKIFSKFSGICHHMLIQKSVIEHLFSIIEKEHGMKPWQAICKCVDIKEIDKASLSEYEIYFNFIFTTSQQAHIRRLTWKNLPSLEKISSYKAQGYDYVSCHAWMRGE